MKNAKAFPVKVCTGSVTVKIYRSKNQKGYTSFVVIHSMAGKRHLKTFSEYEEAYREAKGTADSLSRGEVEMVQLSRADRLTYGHAIDALQPTKVPLELAAKEYAEAHRILGGAASLVEAARFYATRHQHREPKMVQKAIEEMLKSKQQEKVGAEYLKALRCYLGKFSEAFHCPVANVTTSEIGDFLRELKVSNRSKENCRGVLGAFFKYCKERGWVPRDHEGIEYVPRFKKAPAKITIYTPDELIHLLGRARDEMIPYLAIAAFAGLRSAELQRLDWSDIALEDGFITVSAEKSKTASRRLVPISSNLKAWLTPRAEKNGKVVPFDNVPKQLGLLAKAAEVEWKKNALRHSFCSYRLAQIQNAAQVALEAGNSPQVIFAHYRELVRPAEATKWFSIEPKAAENIIPITAAA